MPRARGPLARIKRLVRDGRLYLTAKARREIDLDALTPTDVVEAICSASRIDTVLSSRNPESGERERLYVIRGVTIRGTAVYTKGKLATWRTWPLYDEAEAAYTIISAKRAT